jgi:glycine oxidase
MNGHAVIIGAGAVGCLSALSLARRGWRVTLIDQGVLGGESSWAGGGILFPLLPWNYRMPVNQLALAGAEQHASLCEQLREETGIDPEFQRCGMRILPAFDGESALQWCRANGLAADLQENALWLPQVAQARNPRLMQALRVMLEKQQVRIIEHTSLIPLTSSGNRVERWQASNGELFEADVFVVTAGAWSQDLLGKHTLSLELKPMRGQMLLYQKAPGMLPHVLFHEGFYLIPRKDGLILAGSTVEDVGFDKSTTQDVAADLAAKAAALLPALADAPIIKHWSGLRPGSPDNIPVIAPHPQFDNLYLNTGHFRYGVTMAPASADILTSLICRETPPMDAQAYGFPTSANTPA